MGGLNSQVSATASFERLTPLQTAPGKVPLFWCHRRTLADRSHQVDRPSSAAPQSLGVEGETCPGTTPPDAVTHCIGDIKVDICQHGSHICVHCVPTHRAVYVHSTYQCSMGV